MRAPAYMAKPIIDILFLNMEHSSRKSHVADMTATGKDATYLALRVFTGMKVSNILVHRFHFVYFYSPCHRGFAHGQTRMVPSIAGIVVKPVDFLCYLHVHQW